MAIRQRRFLLLFTVPVVALVFIGLLLFLDTSTAVASLRVKWNELTSKTNSAPTPSEPESEPKHDVSTPIDHAPVDAVPTVESRPTTAASDLSSIIDLALSPAVKQDDAPAVNPTTNTPIASPSATDPAVASATPESTHEKVETPTIEGDSAAVELWQALYPLLVTHAPNVPTPEEPLAGKGHFADLKGKPDPPLTDGLSMSPGDILKMRAAHAGYVSDIRNKILPQRAAAQDKAPRRGIVTVSGGFYLPVTLVSLRMLRNTGCTLPVEVFLSTRDEYEAKVCEEVLPSMNARCRVLDDIFEQGNLTTGPEGGEEQKGKDAKTKEKGQQKGKGGEEGEKKEPLLSSGFQLKIFAMLFSSYDQILFLDADCFPLHDPAELFDSQPFTIAGLVTWPDMWTRSISPAYYLITSSRSPPPADAGHGGGSGGDTTWPDALGSRAATEAGQLVVDRTRQLDTLLLSAYYNFYGPSHYYLLLNQGGAGRGDKDTIIPAARALGRGFHAVQEPPLGVGHRGHSRDKVFVYALIQHDAIQDAALSRAAATTTTGAAGSGDRNEQGKKRPRAFFLHANTPKWNPLNVFDHPGAYDLTWDIDGHQAPAYQAPEDAVATIPGVERRLWDEVRWVGCELERGYFKEWNGRSRICDKIKNHFATVLEKDEKGKTADEKKDEGEGEKGKDEKKKDEKKADGKE